MPDRINLEWGYIEYGPNELSIVSTVEDPPGLRLATLNGGSLGKLSFNRMRPDGVQEEIVLLQGKEDERYRGASPPAQAGEVTLHLRRPFADGDGAMVPIATLRYDGVTFHVPTTSGGAAVPEFLRSADGRFRCHMQGDGNLVVYDEETGQAVWASGSVVV